MVKEIVLRDVAFARSGDKGDVSNVHVHPYRERDYQLLLDRLTVERVRAAFGALVDGPIERYELPGSSSINFVMHDALDGGVVGRSLNRDIHGKSRGNLMMEMKLEVPDEFEPPTDHSEIDGHQL